MGLTVRHACSARRGRITRRPCAPSIHASVLILREFPRAVKFAKLRQIRLIFPRDQGRPKLESPCSDSIGAAPIKGASDDACLLAISIGVLSPRLNPGAERAALLMLNSDLSKS